MIKGRIILKQTQSAPGGCEKAATIYTGRNENLL